MGCQGSEVQILSRRPSFPENSPVQRLGYFFARHPDLHPPLAVSLSGHTLSVKESPISCGTDFIQNRLKPFESIARIRDFSAGNSYREVETRVMESPTGLQSSEASTHDASS